MTEPASETAEGTEQPPRKGAQAVLEQMGGVSGLIYSSLPVLVFVPASTNFGLLPAIYAALGVAALVLVWRLIRKESLQPAVSGFVGVGISALIAWYMGESKGFFLYGIYTNLVYAGIFTLSLLIRRPLVGYAWGWVSGHGHDWRGVRKAVHIFDAATFVWVLVFASRYIVQNHLYDNDEVGLLGVARIAMGWPLTGLAAVITYFVIRTAQRALQAETAAQRA